MSIGDVMSQKIQHGQEVTSKEISITDTTSTKEATVHTGDQAKSIDWTRNTKMFVVGAIQGPLHHYFYGWLDGKYVAATLRNTSIKILYDQMVMSPLCIAAFFYPAGWMFGQSTTECNKEFKEKFLKVYVTDWIVWPATQFINFYYLPPQYRVIYVNAITMVYNVFLSHVKHDNHKSIDSK